MRQHVAQRLNAAGPMWARMVMMVIVMITVVTVQAQSNPVPIDPSRSQGKKTEAVTLTPEQAKMQALENDRQVQLEQEAKLKQTMATMAIPEGVELSPEKRAYLLGLEQPTAARPEDGTATPGSVIPEVTSNTTREGTVRLAEPVDNLTAPQE